MKLNFNQPVKNADGTNLKDLMLSKALSSLLSNGNSGNPVKAWEMAVRVEKEGEIDVDTPDKEFVEKAIESSNLTDAIKAQLLLVIKTSK